MTDLRLSFACGPYDRTQALRDGTIRAEGIDLVYVSLQPGEIFWRMLQYKEFDVAEMSMSNFISLVSHNDRSFVGIPVFLSRMFRHSFIFINTEKGIENPKHLIGKRVGVPEYSQTAAVMIRGLLQHEYGVHPRDLNWVQGRPDRINQKLPDEITIQPAPANSELGEMLEAGQIDCFIGGNNPLPFRRGSPKVRRLFPNYKSLEREYFEKTRIYPIMHMVVVRREIYEKDPWVALSLYRAMTSAKDRCQNLLLETGSPKASFCWLQAMIEEEQSVFGKDWFPYGVETNRPSIEAILRFNFEQGLTHRQVRVEELFAPSTLREVPLSEGAIVF